MALTSTNPATGEEIDQYPLHTAEDVDRRLDRAATGFETNRERSFGERAERLRRAADLLEENAGSHGALMTNEMGKPIDQAEA